MWFDPHRALKELDAVPRLAKHRVAKVAIVATPPVPKSKPAPPMETGALSPETYRHGLSITGDPKTWTGRIVSPAVWQTLTEWEWHGQDGRRWNGITQQWEHPGGNDE